MGEKPADPSDPGATDGDADIGSILSTPLRHRLIGGGMWATSSYAATFLLSLAVSGLAARLLNPEGAGAYFLILSLVTAGATLGQLGLNRAVVRLISEALAQNQPGRARTAARLIAGGGALSAALVVSISALPVTSAALSAAFPSSNLATVSVLIGLLIGARVLGLLRAQIFRGFHDLKFASIFQALDWYLITAGLLGAVSFLVGGPVSLELVLWLTAAGWLPGMLVGWYMLGKRVGRLQGAGTLRTRALAKLSWPLWVAGLGGILLGHGDMWVAGASLPPSDVALYGAAFRLVHLVSAPLTVIDAVVQPIMAELYSRGETEKLQRILRASGTVAGIPGAGVLLAFMVGGGLILSLVFGDFYQDAWPILALMSGGYMVNVLVGSCGFLLMMSGHERAYMLISVVAGVLMISSAAVLVQYAGAVGVAGAAALGHALKNVLTWGVTRRLTGVSTHVGIGPGWEAVRGILREVQKARAGSR